MSSEAGTKQVSHFKGASPKSLESLDSACQGKRQGKRRLMVNAKFVLPASTTNNLRIPIHFFRTTMIPIFHQSLFSPGPEKDPTSSFCLAVEPRRWML